MLSQKEIKTKCTETLRKSFYVKCAICGQFVHIDKEYNGYFISCENCNTEVFVKYLSYKNINHTKNFCAIFKTDKKDTIEIFKENVLPVHSMDNYISH